MTLDLALFVTYAPLMLSGLATTAIVCAGALVIAVALGLVLALGLMSRLALLRVACRTYVELMRGTPVLIVLFLLYYGGPSFGLVLDAVTAGVVGLGVYSAAFFAELFRAGFRSIPVGQVEAALMLGLGPGRIVGRIKIPQMLALIVPPFTNQTILLVKESALLSIITVTELTMNATQMANETFAVFEPFLLVALLYWVFIEAIAQTGSVLERKVGWRR